MERLDLSEYGVLRRWRALSSDELEQLFEFFWHGDADERRAARHEIAECNMRLAAMIARRWQRSDMGNDDALGYAFVGLMRAIDRYDPNRGAFGTCLAYCVKQAVLRGGYASRSSGIVLSASVCEQHLPKALRAKERGLSPYEVASTIGQSVDHVHALLAHEVRLDDPLTDAQDGTIGDMLVSEADTEERALTNCILEVVRQALDSLPVKTRRIIEARFGLDGNGDYGQGETARLFGMRSRKAIRYHELKAFDILRPAVEGLRGVA